MSRTSTAEERSTPVETRRGIHLVHAAGQKPVRVAGAMAPRRVTRQGRLVVLGRRHGRTAEWALLLRVICDSFVRHLPAF